ncbi:hypothetical protein J6S88_02050 [bacterium]|nr:hypothetical protein [bacterium]
MKYFIAFLVLTILFCEEIPVFAQKTAVEITPVQKITTSKRISEGDYLEFKVLNNKDIVRGVVSKYEPNGFAGKEAILVIDNFKSLNSDNKYCGTIALNGNQHNQIMDFFTVFAQYVRGGEITILPEKNVFELWMEK